MIVVEETMALGAEVIVVKDEAVAVVVVLVPPASYGTNMAMMPSIAGTVLIRILFLLHCLHLQQTLLNHRIHISLRITVRLNHNAYNLPILLHTWPRKNVLLLGLMIHSLGILILEYLTR